MNERHRQGHWIGPFKVRAYIGRGSVRHLFSTLVGSMQGMDWVQFNKFGVLL
jgi:hypothetical protein